MSKAALESEGKPLALGRQRFYVVIMQAPYRDSHGTESKRRVDPGLLAYTSDHWYFVAYCRNAEAIRWFRLDHIKAANLTNQSASYIPIDSVGKPPSSARAVGDF